MGVTGDPMWRCPFCEKQHYSNNSCECDCVKWKTMTNLNIYKKEIPNENIEAPPYKVVTEGGSCVNDIPTIDRSTKPDKMSCSVCGSYMTRIRGRYPHGDDRIVCPTCMADKLDDIHSMSDPDYRKAYQDKK